jgi:hypothetical protein
MWGCQYHVVKYMIIFNETVKGIRSSPKLSKPVYMWPDDGLVIRAETGSLCIYMQHLIGCALTAFQNKTEKKYTAGASVGTFFLNNLV